MGAGPPGPVWKTLRYAKTDITASWCLFFTPQNSLWTLLYAICLPISLPLVSILGVVDQSQELTVRLKS